MWKSCLISEYNTEGIYSEIVHAFITDNTHLANFPARSLLWNLGKAFICESGYIGDEIARGLNRISFLNAWANAIPRYFLWQLFAPFFILFVDGKLYSLFSKAQISGLWIVLLSVIFVASRTTVPSSGTLSCCDKWTEIGENWGRRRKESCLFHNFQGKRNSDSPPTSPTVEKDDSHAAVDHNKPHFSPWKRR